MGKNTLLSDAAPDWLRIKYYLSPKCGMTSNRESSNSKTNVASTRPRTSRKVGRREHGIFGSRSCGHPWSWLGCLKAICCTRVIFLAAVTITKLQNRRDVTLRRHGSVTYKLLWKHQWWAYTVFTHHSVKRVLCWKHWWHPVYLEEVIVKTFSR
jgi:hypothetical protein